jgi:hypothetical protein
VFQIVAFQDGPPPKFCMHFLLNPSGLRVQPIVMSDHYEAVCTSYLFMVYLTTLSVTQTVIGSMIGFLMNWKGYERKRSWLNLRHYPAFTGLHVESGLFRQAGEVSIKSKCVQ